MKAGWHRGRLRVLAVALFGSVVGIAGCSDPPTNSSMGNPRIRANESYAISDSLPHVCAATSCSSLDDVDVWTIDEELWVGYVNALSYGRTDCADVYQAARNMLNSTKIYKVAVNYYGGEYFNGMTQFTGPEFPTSAREPHSIYVASFRFETPTMRIHTLLHEGSHVKRGYKPDFITRIDWENMQEAVADDCITFTGFV